MTKTEILGRTDSGLAIYGLVLNEIYPGETNISMNGWGVELTKNPFNQHRKTLKIMKEGGVYQYFDTELPAFRGGPFDFAALHYRLEGKELEALLARELFEKSDVRGVLRYEVLRGAQDDMHEVLRSTQDDVRSKGLALPQGFATEVMTARPPERSEGPRPRRPRIKSSLPLTPSPSRPVRPPERSEGPSEGPRSPSFSFYRSPIKNITPLQITTLVDVYNLIRSRKYEKQTLKLRAAQTPEEARKIKAGKFDYVTFSGVFSSRRDTALVKHSGLMTIDFDHVPDVNKLKKQLLNDEYFTTELMFVSPSGDGLKWIIPVDLYLVRHQSYFSAVAAYIRKFYGLEVDKSGRDISRACFLPHDPEVYINPKYLNQ